MEVTCHRCHQAVPVECCFCPTCGLPQLVYTAEVASGQVQVDRWTDAVRDASSVDWKPAMRAALVFAVPAGLLSSGLSPLSFFGLFWMAAGAAWAVVLYVRRQGPAWITMGAGARIGLVTGLMAVWLAFAFTGGILFVERFMMHQSSSIDAEWKTQVIAKQQLTDQWYAGLSAADAMQAQAARLRIQKWILTPWGQAGSVAFGMAIYSLIFLLFAVCGGALGARILARVRRPQT